MPFLRKIWNDLFPKTVNDPEFGILTLDWTGVIDFNDKPEELWIGKADFAPLGRSVRVKFILESELGASPFQRELYHSVEARWPFIRDELARWLLERIHEWFGDATQAGIPSTEQLFQNWSSLDVIFIRNSSPHEPQWADAVLDFSILPGALTNPSLLETLDHYLSAQLVEGEVVRVTWA